MSQVRVAVWNVGGGDKAGDAVKKSLTNLRTNHADVLLLSEVADRKPQLPADGWGLYQPDGSGKDHCAISWRQGSLFDAGTKDTVKIADADTSVTTGAGGVQNKWLHRVVLNHNKSGRPLQMMVVHMVASVEGDKASPEDKEKRRDAYRQAVKGIDKRCNQLADNGVIIIGGDWNTDWNNDLNDPLRDRMKLGNADKNTHGDRQIDFALIEKQQHGIAVESTKTLDLDPSDHKALVVTYDIT
jgi:Endonuclease/Exonuclease/phosphatase family